MMYTMNESLAEIKKRSAAIKTRRSARRAYVWTGSCLAVMALLMGLASVKSGLQEHHLTQTPFGASIVTAEAGGYVLVGVICFVAAVALTLACIRYRDRHNR